VDATGLAGTDIDPVCVASPIEASVPVQIGDARDPVSLDHILGDAEFAVIIDNGSF
jgi:hypothetical protein